MPILVIVESPTKARKLTGYLGKDYQVEASVGHIRDLPKSKLGVDVEADYEPQYVVPKDKVKTVKFLAESAKAADTIVLATDPDREGEAIAWHVQHLLQEKAGKTEVDFVRATFQEITKQAVTNAIKHPHALRLHLVDAQQARRVLDRLVGYQLSPVLWKKVRRGLSAGRVQSVALRLVVEREREIEAFVADEYWQVQTLVSTQPGQTATSPLVRLQDDDTTKPEWLDTPPDSTMIASVEKVADKKFQPVSQSDVDPVIAHLERARYSISQVDKTQRKRSSLPPFTTSTLQQAAASRLGMSGKQTMRLAQQLYEEGLITYHRTDSLNLSKQAIDMARQHILTEYGQSYLPGKIRIFTNKSKNAQEAHEAIRVTDTSVSADKAVATVKGLTERHGKLYDLIWRRFVASQMEQARYDQTKISITATDGDWQAELQANGSVLKFDGWMRLFPNREDTLVPEVFADQDLYFQAGVAEQKFTQPPPRYNDASLVKELEKRGIGRPSTYASIISVILDRGYVERDQKRFKATAVGMTVNDFLLKHFPKVMDYDFTARMENDLDEIAQGNKNWKKVIAEFHQPLEKVIDDVTENAQRMQVPTEKTGNACPTCGDEHNGEEVIRTGRYGKFLSCNRYPECEYTAPLIETLDGVVCPLCQRGDVVIKNTRYGKNFFGCGRYPDCDWASWKKPEPGQIVTAEEWAEQQAAREAKKQARAKKKGTGSK